MMTSLVVTWHSSKVPLFPSAISTELHVRLGSNFACVDRDVYRLMTSSKYLLNETRYFFFKALRHETLRVCRIWLYNDKPEVTSWWRNNFVLLIFEYYFLLIANSGTIINQIDFIFGTHTEYHLQICAGHWHHDDIITCHATSHKVHFQRPISTEVQIRLGWNFACT